MPHEIENMAFTNEKPWHGLGIEVANNLSSEEMMIAAGCDWTVAKAAIFTHYSGVEILVEGSAALLRTSDNKVLDIVGEDWEPLQNAEAFKFFKEFIDAGQMTMETAGSLKGGQLVWALAKVGKSFTLFGGDRVEAYLLFTNSHKYGLTIDVRFTPIRVVCNNTLTMALGGKGNYFKVSHRVVFDAAKAKETLKIAEAKLDAYEAAAAFLGSKRYTEETVADYFNQVFPVQVVKEKVEAKRKVSKNANLAQLALIHQPGVEFAPGSWWQAANSISYVTDHLMGRTEEARVENFWYGPVKDKKNQAFELALEMAKKS